MKIKLFIKPIIWLILICIGLFLPAEDLPKKPFLIIPYFDKLVHLSLFFVFTILLFRPFKRLNLKYMFWAPFTATFFGAFLESVQRTITVSRSTDMHDFIANIMGIAFAIVFYWFFISGKKWEQWL